jgi:hypothetical protein
MADRGGLLVAVVSHWMELPISPQSLWHKRLLSHALRLAQSTKKIETSVEHPRPLAN